MDTCSFTPHLFTSPPSSARPVPAPGNSRLNAKVLGPLGASQSHQEEAWLARNIRPCDRAKRSAVLGFTGQSQANSQVDPGKPQRSVGVGSGALMVE